MGTTRKFQFCIMVGGFLMMASEAHSSAFMLNENSTTASGRSYAGGAAIADDASTIFSNPAGMTELKRSEVQIGTYMIAPNAEITNRGSNSAGTPFAGQPGQGFEPQLAGNLYFAAPISEKLWAGFAVTVPFALKNEYDKDFIGRYDSTSSDIRVIDLGPSVAYKIDPKLSIGGGLDVQYAHAKLVKAIPVTVSTTTDGEYTVEGSDWSVGYNVGALYKPRSDLRLGLTYRAAIDHKIEGDATTDAAAIATHTKQHFSSDLRLPDTTALGVAYDLTPSVTLLSQLSYYGWSRFNEVRLKLADGTEQATTENFRDTWSLSVGAQWAAAPGWKLRAGMLYDQTPTRDQYRSTIIPDVDRLWASIGASYDITDAIALDVSYAHMFAKDGPINRTNVFPGGLPTVQTSATTETSADIIGLSLRFQF